AFLGFRGTSAKQPGDHQSKHPTTSSTFIHDAEPTDRRPSCNQRNSRVDAERKESRKNFARKEKLAFSSAWPATGASLNACGTNTIGSVFFSNKTGKRKSTCSCWKHILMIRAATKLSHAKWVGRSCSMRKTGAQRWTPFWMRPLPKRKSSTRKIQLPPAKPSRSTVFIALLSISRFGSINCSIKTLRCKTSPQPLSWLLTRLWPARSWQQR